MPPRLFGHGGELAVAVVWERPEPKADASDQAVTGSRKVAADTPVTENAGVPLRWRSVERL